jgi:hypothetical protein
MRIALGGVAAMAAGLALAQAAFGIAWNLSLIPRGTGTGYVDSSPAGIDCGRNTNGHSDCLEAYEEGTPVTLTAHPDPGSEFNGFAGGPCTGTALTCTVPMSEEYVVKATFDDVAPPDTRITHAPKKRTTKTEATIRFTASEVAATYTCQLDKAKPKRCTPPYEKRLKPGKHEFSVFATDIDGNDDPTPAKVRWTILKD